MLRGICAIVALAAVWRAHAAPHSLMRSLKARQSISVSSYGELTENQKNGSHLMRSKARSISALGNADLNASQEADVEHSISAMTLGKRSRRGVVVSRNLPQGHSVTTHEDAKAFAPRSHAGRSNGTFEKTDVVLAEEGMEHERKNEAPNQTHWMRFLSILVLVIVTLLCAAAMFALSLRPSLPAVTDAPDEGSSSMALASLASGADWSRSQGQQITTTLIRLASGVLGEFSGDGEMDMYLTRKHTFEDALEIPQNVMHLSQVLKSEGIDTSSWGSALKELQDQLLRCECSLVYSLNREGSCRVLVRKVRLLIVKIAAVFPDGLRVLKCVGVTDHLTGHFKAKHQECAKKLEVDDDVHEVLTAMLVNELQLSVEWQEKHLRLVHEEQTHLRSGWERGQSFPGLASHYLTERVVMKLGNIDSKTISGKLNLPEGSDTFQIEEATLIKDKTRSWRWEPVAAEDDSDKWASK